MNGQRNNSNSDAWEKNARMINIFDYLTNGREKNENNQQTAKTRKNYFSIFIQRVINFTDELSPMFVLLSDERKFRMI